MVQPRRSRRLREAQTKQPHRGPELSLQRMQAEDVINLHSEPTPKASAIEPGEQFGGNENNHPSTTPVSSAGPGQAEYVIGSYSEPIAKPQAADGSLSIEEPSGATEGPAEERAGSALRTYSNIARDALSLLETNEARSEGGTPHVKDATSKSDRPHPSAPETPSRKSPCSTSSTHVGAHPKLPKGENPLKTDSSERQAKGYLASLLMRQLLGEGEASSPLPQTAMLPQKTINLMVCWWLQVFGSLHDLGNKVTRL